MRYRFKNCKQIPEVFNDKIWFHIDLKLLKFQTITIVHIRQQVVFCEASFALILRCFWNFSIGHLFSNLGNAATGLSFPRCYI